MCISPNCNQLAVGFTNGSNTILDIRTEKIILNFTSAYSDNIQVILF